MSIFYIILFYIWVLLKFLPILLYGLLCDILGFSSFGGVWTYKWYKKTEYGYDLEIKRGREITYWEGTTIAKITKTY